jgi:hypothetical protein
MNPDDLASLTDMMDLELINSSAAEVYAGHITDSGARLGSDGPVEVWVAGDPMVPAGRYRIRQGRPLSASPLVSAGQPVSAVQPLHAAIPPNRMPFNAHDGHTRGEHPGARAVDAGAGLLTVAEAPAIPPLRLVTSGSVAETRLSGARAGRGAGSELMLPAVPTVSRVHATFSFSGGQWWITSLGRNGLTLNGAAVAGERPVSDGDVIAWGSGPEALTSRVQIG